MVFDGEPGVRGHATAPDDVSDGFDDFLSTVDMTFRKDPETGRPRANKPGSQKDREQRSAGEFYE
jgi:ATP-binding cassette subfamily E protein 1